MDSKRYRVLYVLQPGDGGAVTSLYDLVLGLDTNLFEPIILFYEPDRYYEKFQALGVKVYSLTKHYPLFSKIHECHTTEHQKKHYGKWLFNFYRGIHIAYLLINVLILIKSQSIDLVHQNDSLPKYRFTVLAAKLARVPQVCHMRSFYEDLSSRLICSLIESVNAFIYVSKAVEQFYLHRGIPAKKGQVSYEGFVSRPFEQVSVSEITKIRTEFGVTESDFLICNAGRLIEWKGQNYFLEAISRIIASHPNIKALVVGSLGSSSEDNSYFSKLQELVIELNLSNHVIFTGLRDDLAQIMVASDIVVHSSSEAEPFGRVPIEGMLAGCAVIATAVGGPLETIEDQVTGLLVPPKDASKIAEAILWVINHPEQSSQMSNIAQQRAKERFSIEKHVFSIQQLYRTILKH